MFLLLVFIIIIIVSYVPTGDSHWNKIQRSVLKITAKSTIITTIIEFPSSSAAVWSFKSFHG